MENVAILARYRNFPFSIINSQLLLLVFFSEFLHEVDELLNALDRHCVIDGSTHAAYRTVALQVGHAGCHGLLGKLCVQLVVAGAEGYVHVAAGILCGYSLVEVLKSR